jgi:threonyl-tRNA synthetase
MQKVPFILVAGDKEKAAGTVSVRARGNKDMGALSVEDFLKLISEHVQTKV